MRKFAIAAILFGILSTPVFAQVASGRVTTAAPTYTNNTAGALSLDTSGNLRVTGSFTPAALQDVNLTEIDGVAVSNTTPGTLDVTCISGCVAGSGVINYTNTAAAPSYVEGTNNAASADLAGNARVTLTTALPAGTNNIGDVDVLTLPALPAGTNNIGDVDVLTLPAIPAGTNNIGDVDIASVADPGTSNFSLIAAASTNSTSVKGSAGTLYELSLYNNSANIAYLKLYNSASAPTCGSGTPVARYLIPGAASGGAGSNVVIPLGKTFSTGIGFCVTGGIADADTTAVAASAFLVNLTYK